MRREWVASTRTHALGCGAPHHICSEGHEHLTCQPCCTAYVSLVTRAIRPIRQAHQRSLGLRRLQGETGGSSPTGKTALPYPAWMKVVSILKLCAVPTRPRTFMMQLQEHECLPMPRVPVVCQGHVQHALRHKPLPLRRVPAHPPSGQVTAST